MSYSHSVILNQPSHVIIAPTDTTAATPYGGTVLGYTDSGVELGLKTEWVEIFGAETGAALLDLRYAGTDVSIVVKLQQWDADTIQRFFPGGLSALGATSGKRYAQYPGTLTLGSSGRDNAGILMIDPLDTTNNSVIIGRVAIPQPEATQRLNWKLRDPLMLSLVFRLVEDTSISTGDARYDSRTAYIGDITDAAAAVS